MPKLLFTKVLDAQQHDALVKAGIEVSSYDAIRIQPVSPEWEGDWDHAIFSSKNAVRSVMNKDRERLPDAISCVGSKTAALLREHGFSPRFEASSAEELCKLLQALPKTESFLFFRGNRSLPTIPTCLENAGFRFREVLCYHTNLAPREEESPYDAIAFMSPSAISSYLQANQAGSAIALCIGPTTAKAAETHFNRIEIAGEPTLEALLSLAKTTLTA